MRLYMQQKVFSFTDRFTIRDESGADRYFVEGEFLSLGKQLHILDAKGYEVAFVRQRLLTFLPKFEVYVDGRFVAEIVKEFTFLRPKYTLRGTDWTIDGDFWAHEYTINDAAGPIVSISKVWFSWGDSFELDVFNEADEVMAVATVLAIDCVMDASEH